MREEGDTHLANLVSRVNPDDYGVTDVSARLPSHPAVLLTDVVVDYVILVGTRVQWLNNGLVLRICQPDGV